jgi:hypothetical protein
VILANRRSGLYYRRCFLRELLEPVVFLPVESDLIFMRNIETVLLCLTNEILDLVHLGTNVGTEPDDDARVLLVVFMTSQIMDLQEERLEHLIPAEHPLPIAMRMQNNMLRHPVSLVDGQKLDPDGHSEKQRAEVHEDLAVLLHRASLVENHETVVDDAVVVEFEFDVIARL